MLRVSFWILSFRRKDGGEDDESKAKAVGIKRDWVEATVENPDFKEDDPESDGPTRAYRKIPEQDGRVLRVITAFFDRSQK